MCYTASGDSASCSLAARHMAAGLPYDMLLGSYVTDTCRNRIHDGCPTANWLVSRNCCAHFVWINTVKNSSYLSDS